MFKQRWYFLKKPCKSLTVSSLIHTIFQTHSSFGVSVCSLRILWLWLVFTFVSCQFEKGNPQIMFYKGADLSFLPEIEENNTQFFEGNEQKEVIEILQKNGMNLVRLRLWHTPAPEHKEHSSLEEVLKFAQSIKKKNLAFLLDFHYSDTWADPGKQFVPKAWEGLDLMNLGDSIFRYTQQVMEAFEKQNTPPDIVQIGNETNSGMLWNLGRVGGNFENNWANYAFLIKKAIQGVKTIDTQNKVKIMLHFAGFEGAEWFFGNIANQSIAYDMMGISYYPLWHGKSLSSLENALNSLILQFDKDILIVETAYPWTLAWNDQTHNFIGETNQLIPQYPATPQGQLDFMMDLKQLIRGLKNKRGVGFCYWEPAWVAFKGSKATDGSVWENQTLFDFSNKALPAIQALKE